MIIKVDESMFIQQFENYERVGENGFSYRALRALFNHYDELDSECGTQTKLDVIALCCDWNEMDEYHLFQDYCYLGEFADVDDLIEELNNRTTVLDLGAGEYLVQTF